MQIRDYLGINFLLQALKYFVVNFKLNPPREAKSDTASSFKLFA